MLLLLLLLLLPIGGGVMTSYQIFKMAAIESEIYFRVQV